MDTIQMRQLCWTGTTLYGIDEDGYGWFIEMRSGTTRSYVSATERSSNE